MGEIFRGVTFNNRQIINIDLTFLRKPEYKVLSLAVLNRKLGHSCSNKKVLYTNACLSERIN